jgi:predicted CoA-substrate-specific enzyme activase
MKEIIGVCLGASTVSFVRVSLGDSSGYHIKDHASYPHDGNPQGAFLRHLRDFNQDKLPVIVTGRKFRNFVNLRTISEPEATELALEYINNGHEQFSAVASLGGETFLVYNLDEEGRIANVISKNQCASGTGEFFLQQIKRMDLDIESAIEISQNVEPYKVSGRCSVFCKSDCTHALNKGTPKPEVTSGLAAMIAEKVEELLNKARPGKFLLVGGVTRNITVIEFIRKKFKDIVIPGESAYFEALGAAIYGIKNDVENFPGFDNIIKQNVSYFVFHEPLWKYKDKVQFRELHFDKAETGDKCIIGLDVGSTTTKAVIIRLTDSKILGSVYLYTNGNPVKSAKECYAKLEAQIDNDINIIGLGVTGSGRHIAGLHAMTDSIYNEIIAHATAALYFDPGVDTIFEIGGQDAKYTHIINKMPADYAMNEACSAGTGSFIEESAWESLRVNVRDIESIALSASRPPNFSDQCSAFISSDIKTAQQENIGRDDIIAGLVYSICLNYINRVKGNRPVGKKIFMQGGVCYNKAIPIAMAALTGKDIIVPPEPGLMGAFGVALEVKEKLRLGLLEEKKFSLKALAGRDVLHRKPFVCMGGSEKCDRRCVINMVEVESRKYPFGGACNKYYNTIQRTKIDASEFDYVAKRNQLMFKKYIRKTELEKDAISVGMNLSFHTFTLYPLFYNFFTQLGCRVILPDSKENSGSERELTSMCYPAQLSHGLFQNLLEKNPDFYFIPNLIEMFSGENVYQKLDNNCSCIFVSGEPYYLQQAFKDYPLNGNMLSPILNFRNGYDTQREKFHEVARKIGLTDKSQIDEALDFALNMQSDYQAEMIALGQELLYHLKENPDKFAMILVGRPYNSFTDTANKGIPQKFASRGVYVLPYDMLDFSGELIDNDMYWEGGKKILKVAKIIKKHPQLFATYVSNYSCAPDSMIIPMFRSIQGIKPSLTLELDGHTADAGINTRIDAALDIISNFRKISSGLTQIKSSDYRQAKIEFGKTEGYIIGSDGERVPLRDPDVTIIVPSMGDLASRLFAAGLRSQGFNSIALPEAGPDILKIGRSYTTGKECLPLLLCIGGMMDYIENKWDGKGYLAFFIVQGAGNCRLGYYPTFIKNVIKDKLIRNVTTIELMHEEGFAGLGPQFASRGIETLIASDVLDDVRSAILANSVNPGEGAEIFEEEFEKFLIRVEKEYQRFYKSLGEYSTALKARIPSVRHISQSKYIALLGEMYVRRDGFSHKWLNKHFAKKGFIVKDAYISEWIYYVDYLIKSGLYEPEKSVKNRWERLVRSTYMKISEYRIKKILVKSGYYQYSKTRVKPLVEHGKHIVPLDFKGEPLLILGTGINDTLEKYAGIISVGPFGCMQTRFAEAVTLPEMKVENKLQIKKAIDPDYKLPQVFSKKMSIPFLPIETDGNVYPQVIEARIESFALQAERVAGLMHKSRNGKSKLNHK